jgi:cyclase
MSYATMLWGGITSVNQVIKLVDMGVEKVAISAAAIRRPSLIKELISAVGNQSIVVVLDVYKNKNFFSEKYEIRTHNADKSYKEDPFTLIKLFQDYGVGEIIINSINRDGLMQGYDLDLVAKVKSIAKVPITFLGGAGSLRDIRELFGYMDLVGAGVGSLFVFKGKYRAVLINYPTYEQKIDLFTYTINNKEYV